MQTIAIVDTENLTKYIIKRKRCWVIEKVSTVHLSTTHFHEFYAKTLRKTLNVLAEWPHL